MAVRASFKERGKHNLRRLSSETGGGFFEVSDRQPIENIYAHIEDELRGQYSIGYVSDAADNGGAFRKIRLTAGSKLMVRTRDGYYPK
jgi:VWFA-related protein